MESNIIRFFIIFLLTLLFSLCGNEAKSDQDQTHPQMQHSNAMAFFKPEALKLGAIMPNQPFITPDSEKANFISKQKADSIPFSLSQLPSLLHYFGFDSSSSEAKAMEETLSRCEVSAMEGETVFCATSLESMLDSVSQIFEMANITSGFTAVTTKLVNKKIINEATNYYTVVAEPRRVYTPTTVSCHLLPYPYAIYTCHSMDNNDNKTMTKVYTVSLKGENNGEIIETISVCHMDSSMWDPTHYSFTEWGIVRGSPACHFFPTSDIVWLALSSKDLDSEESASN